jgi:NADPH2:quinone reductase
MVMKAVLCKQFGPPESLVLEELPALKAGPGEVVVSVKAASVNFPDVLIIQNKYQFKPPLPFSPGSELAGLVKEVGDGVKNVKVGDRVIAFTTYGAFAEEVKVEAGRLVPMPEGTRVAATSSASMPLASRPFDSRGAWLRSSSANFSRSLATMV